MASTLVFGMTACQGSDSGSGSETAGTGAADTGAGSTQESYDPLGAYDETVTLSIGRGTVQNPKLPDGASYENNAYNDWVKERLNIRCTECF